jgi:hypothetical protein
MPAVFRKYRATGMPMKRSASRRRMAFLKRK